MGQGQSLQSPTLPSREEILKRTNNGKTLIKDIFSWMVYQADIKEFYSLANPDHCSKYIFITANALDALFKKIQLEPQEGQKGMIYLQKAQFLTNPEEPQLKEARKLLCTKLAFFYVRIFQIFAALALSVLDVDTASEGKLINVIGQLRQSDQYIPLFGKQQGGALSQSRFLPKAFEDFRPYLKETQKENIYEILGTEQTLYLKLSQKEETDTLKLLYLRKSSQLNKLLRVESDIKVEKTNDDKLLSVYLINIHDVEDNSSLREDIKIKFVYSNIDRSWKDSSTNDPINIRLFEVFEEYIYEDVLLGKKYRNLLKQKQQTRKNTNYKNRNTGKYNSYTRRDDYGRSKAYNFQEASRSVQEGLHTKMLLESFNPPPKAHCIARSLQLLSESGLQAKFPAEVYSSICKTKFLTDSRSLPVADSGIDKEVGIYALSQLFYDVIRESMPAISEKTREQQQAFTKKMAFVFEEKKDEQKQFSQIKNKLPSGICDEKSKDRILKITNRDLIFKLRDTVRKMIDQQISHTANVVLLLKKMFLLPIKPGDRLEIHPNVRRLGMQEVNRLAQEARNLLIAYYENCEIFYRIGVQHIQNNKSLVTVV